MANKLKSGCWNAYTFVNEETGNLMCINNKKRIPVFSSLEETVDFIKNNSSKNSIKVRPVKVKIYLSEI